MDVCVWMVWNHWGFKLVTDEHLVDPVVGPVVWVDHKISLCFPFYLLVLNSTTNWQRQICFNIIISLSIYPATYPCEAPTSDGRTRREATREHNAARKTFIWNTKMLFNAYVIVGDSYPQAIHLCSHVGNSSSRTAIPYWRGAIEMAGMNEWTHLIWPG